MKRLSVVVMVALALGACALPEGDAPPAEEPTALPPASIGSGTIVHLFEWRWDDVAQECEDVLGPAGFAAVQVSPPTENHVVSGRPWWERYQPVSYQIETRSGNRQAFQDMVSRCGAAGVDVYVDAVINHMTDADLEHGERTFTGRGTAGSSFSSFDYPGLFGFDDFNHCGLTDNDDIHDFSDRAQVESCELVDLADLATGTDHVRTTLAAYLKDLASLGVAGLRIDAARHMPVDDIAAILREAAWDGYVYQEVTVREWAPTYLATGAVTDFDFGGALSEGVRNGRLADLVERPFWEDDHYRSEAAVVFVDNHDTQRHDQVLNYTHPDYELAVAMMLAVPFGRPRVMSSFPLDDTQAGPPTVGEVSRSSTSTGPETEIRRVHGEDGSGCGDAWICEHRRPLVAGMIQFREVTGDRPISRLQPDGRDRVAFVRGDRGWIAFNRSDEPWEVVHQTGLPGVRYCNVAEGRPMGDGTCAGSTVRVDAGMVSATVPPHGVVAIHVDAQEPR